MGRIHLLENDVIDKIAAGEVVERPASVVKELVDNAIDAGATSIVVSLKEGGKAHIAVTDNGFGMSAEDARLALRRHATSKIASESDLFEIQTRGFRGEALASISAVSRFTLSTRRADDEQGIRIVVDGEERRELPYSGPVGTTMVCEELFATVPVRKKFLKSPQVEWGYCVDVLQHQALSHPDVAFTVLHNDKEQWRLPACDINEDSPQWGAAALKQRAKDLFGAQKADPLLYVDFKEGAGSVEGLIAPPGFERSNAKQMYMFVNGRPVKDKTVRFGIMRGYHSHLLKGKYPFAILNLKLDPALVDVNVHPAKVEMRFQYGSDVQDLLARSIRESIRSGAWARPIVETESLTPDLPPSMPVASFSRPAPRMGPSASSPSLSANRAKPSSFASAPTRPVSSSDLRSGDAREILAADAAFSQEVFDAPQAAGSLQEDASLPWDQMRFVGDFGHCYLFFSSPDDKRLLVVDQHAFHERIIFERLCRDETLLQSQQKLLIPESIELEREDVEALREAQENLAQRGFIYSVLGETTVELSAVPTILAGRDLSALMHDLADPSQAEESVETNADVGRLILATIACHSAVRAGEDLTSDDRQSLLREAMEVDFYLNCPHGRRVFRWFDKGQVGRWFDR